MIDELEAVGPLRIVDASEVDQLLELAFRVVAQADQRLDDLVARDGDREFVERYG